MIDLRAACCRHRRACHAAVTPYDECFDVWCSRDLNLDAEGAALAIAHLHDGRVAERAAIEQSGRDAFSGKRNGEQTIVLQLPVLLEDVQRDRGSSSVIAPRRDRR